MKSKITIKVSYPFLQESIERQFPDKTFTWGNCQFFINQDIEEFDFWFVIDGINNTETAKCLFENTIFHTREPEIIRKYCKKFLRQFGKVATYHKDLKHKNIINTFQWTAWYIGRRIVNGQTAGFTKGYSELKSIKPEKNKLISVISSAKQMSKGHRQRYEFVMKLKEYFEDKIDVFGQGINDFEDKWDVIAPYKYHISLENCTAEDYWTEKLADPFLAGTYPIYYGCPNIHKYFNSESLSIIDINNFDDAVKTIERIIEENTYEKSFDKIQEAKDLILDKYNIIAMMAEYAEKNYLSDAKKHAIKIEPEKNIEFKDYSEPQRPLKSFTRSIEKLVKRFFLLALKRN